MELNDPHIIRKLIDMDKNARKLVEDAEQERRRAEISLATEKSHIETDIMSRAQHRIEKIKNQTGDEKQREARSIEDEGRELLSKLDEAFYNNHEKWEDSLYARCVELP